MSSAGVTLAPPQSYFCYQCNRTVTLSPPPLPNSDLSCPHCLGGFLEEFSPNPNPNPNPNPFSLFPDPFSLFNDPFLSPTTTNHPPIVFSSTTIDLENPRNFSNLLSPSSNVPSFNAFDFLQTYLQGMRARGSNVQIVIENHPSGPGFNLPQNFGDYFLGPGLEQLIQQLAENDPNRYGTPPASKRAIEGLPEVVITADVANSDSNSCAVCLNEFEVDCKAKQMPCKHFFHSECLLQWLNLHNSCPVCRYELLTDDADYESRRENRGQGSSGGGNQNEGGSPGRRFRISLPWPFSALTSSGGSNEGGNGNNESSSGDRQSGGHDSSFMDLD